jgi:hypothetical protein
MFKRIGLFVLAAVIAAFCFGLGERFSVTSMRGFVSTAEAVVGRPATPMSVAGVARRSARRCAAGVTC